MDLRLLFSFFSIFNQVFPSLRISGHFIPKNIGFDLKYRGLARYAFDGSSVKPICYHVRESNNLALAQFRNFDFLFFMGFIFKLECIVAGCHSSSRSYKSSCDGIIIISLLYFPFPYDLKITISNYKYVSWLLALLEHEMVQVEVLDVESLHDLFQLMLGLKFQKWELRKELYSFINILHFYLFQHLSVLVFFQDSEVAICQAHHRGFPRLVMDQSQLSKGCSGLILFDF